MEIKIRKRELLLVIGSFLLPVFLQVRLLVGQIANAKAISVWNIFPTALLVFIFLNAIRMNIWSKKEEEETPNISKNEEKKPIKRSIKTTVIFSVIMAVLFGLSALFFSIHRS